MSNVEQVRLVQDSEMLKLERLPSKISARKLAEGMITVSDNAATNLLIRRVGMERVNARDLGLARTTLRRRMTDLETRSRGDDYTTSAADMVALLGEIRRGSFLSSEARTFGLDLLLGQRSASKIPFTLPSDARYAHKTGDLEGVENDAGLVLLPGRTFALAALARGDVERARPAVTRRLRLSASPSRRLGECFCIRGPRTVTDGDTILSWRRVAAGFIVL